MMALLGLFLPSAEVGGKLSDLSLYDSDLTGSFETISTTAPADVGNNNMWECKITG
eukprot:CAMPEP_0116846682 /NCGR_PEP_ID=MMETSP0418-20121206/13979_1 /TAXON_ID=1158023 /ORGANISM="Astrosyne radiata, Strain 13vi08-1A" /LENGTH=55 /DNA_ID=CAMNT_0004477973 /DNA_START=131 /DNA_END=298 /DNA_ORIENTATION=-